MIFRNGNNPERMRTTETLLLSNQRRQQMTNEQRAQLSAYVGIGLDMNRFPSKDHL